MFIESKVWDGLKGPEMEELFALLGPSIRKSKRKDDGLKQKDIPIVKIDENKPASRVNFIHRDKTFGRLQNGVYFALRDVIKEHRSHIKNRMKVSYELTTNPRNGREKAINVTIIPEG